MKNIHHLMFYSIPKNSDIYKKLIYSLTDPQNEQNENSGPSFKNKVKCIFSKYDAIFIEKIIGTDCLNDFLADYNKASTFII